MFMSCNRLLCLNFKLNIDIFLMAIPCAQCLSSWVYKENIVTCAYIGNWSSMYIAKGGSNDNECSFELKVI
jgi:hypothetical protein